MIGLLQKQLIGMKQRRILIRPYTRLEKRKAGILLLKEIVI